MSGKSFRGHAGWLSLIAGAASLGIVVYVRSKFIFESGRAADNLLLVAMLAAVVTLVLGAAATPRWHLFIALAVFCVVAYCFFFSGSMYAIP